MKIHNLKLKDFVKNNNLIEQEFEYAGIKGVAQILGYNIIFFAKDDNLNKIIAISFFEIEDNELVTISNSILDLIDIKVRFGNSYEIVEGLFGVENFIDTIYDNMKRYNYILSPGLFISLGLEDDVVISMEIITDKEMIKNIISVRKIY